MSSQQKHKIAVVEDELSLSLLYEFKLQNEGFEVRTAANGIDGLRMVKEFNPALILLDLRMPIMNGDEMLQKMRSEDWGSDIRVIILTNISKDEAPRSLRFLSVDRYIVKAHHTPSQVVDTVKNILGL
jgi:two-component system OmpR family response regulator